MFATDTHETENTPNGYSDILSKVDDLIVDDVMEIEISTSELQKFKSLIDNIKVKFHDINITRNEKFQILTLIPTSWSYDDVRHHFHVSKYIFTQARKLQGQKGIMSEPNLNHKGMEKINFKL